MANNLGCSCRLTFGQPSSLQNVAMQRRISACGARAVRGIPVGPSQGACRFSVDLQKWIGVNCDDWRHGCNIREDPAVLRQIFVANFLLAHVTLESRNSRSIRVTSHWGVRRYIEEQIASFCERVHFSSSLALLVKVSSSKQLSLWII